MKKTVLTSLLCMVAVPAFAEDIDKTLDAAPDGHVNVSNIAGSVTVAGWSRDAVEITGTLGRNVKELIFEREGKTVTIKVKVPRNGGRGIESDLDIRIPQKSSLDVATVSADIDVEDVNGEIGIGSVSGDIDTEYFGGDLSAESVSGDVSVDGDGAKGEIETSTVSGDVTLDNVSGEVSAETVSGDLSIDEGMFSRVSIEAVNGDVIFDAGLMPGGKMSIETVNGDVDINFTSKVSARFDVETFNGDIDNCFGADAVRTSRYTPGLELEFTEGDGDGRVSLSSVNGDVEICRD